MNIFEAIEKCKAQGLITMAPPVTTPTEPRDKGVWSEEAKLRMSAAQKERHQREQEKRSASARAFWTPERRAAHSAWLKRLNAHRRTTAGIAQLKKMQAREQILRAKYPKLPPHA